MPIFFRFPAAFRSVSLHFRAGVRKVRLVSVLTAGLLAAPLGAQDGYSLFTTDFPPEEFAARRAKIYDAIGTNGVAVLQGAGSPLSYTRFRQSNEFYYLSGIEVPHAYLVLDGGARRTTLYLPHRNPGRERSEGKLLSAEDAEEVRRLSGIDAVEPAELMGEHLARMQQGTSRDLYTPHAPAQLTAMSRDLGLRGSADLASDPWDGRLPREAVFLNHLRTRLPRFVIKDLSPTLDSMRLIKSPREVALIKKSSDLASLAIMEAMRSVQPGVQESEVDALAKFIYHRNGAMEDAYYSLVASASNAYYPHYHEGKRVMKDGDFLLMDYAPSVGYYTSDVTRMMPVNGKFSPWQRELYGFYLATYKAIIAAIKPGISAQSARLQATAEMDRILASSRFSKPEYTAAAQRFVAQYKAGSQNPNAGLGHWVGMAVHDDGAGGGVLREGMVFSIEPALVVPEEKVYIRLEDMFVITATGVEWLNKNLPMEMDAIEALMKEVGILQRYPSVAASADKM
jgi:Xaa-Pro aminopeptidase